MKPPVKYNNSRLLRSSSYHSYNVLFLLGGLWLHIGKFMVHSLLTVDEEEQTAGLAPQSQAIPGQWARSPEWRDVEMHLAHEKFAHLIVTYLKILEHSC